MALYIKLNGQEYTNFTSANVFRSIETCVGAFKFASSADQFNLFPLKVGDQVQIMADSALVLTGYIEDLSVRYDAGDHEISVSGRSLLCDLIDSSVKTRKEFSGLNTLSGVARAVLNDLGMTGIEIINSAGTIDRFQEQDVLSASASIGENAFSFLEKLARKRQVFLNSDAKGNLVFLRGNRNVIAPIELRNTTDIETNNIKSAKLKIDYKNRFNFYKAQAQINPTFAQLGMKPKDLADVPPGQATDSFIRSTRYFELMNEESGDNATAYNRAQWEANIRRARSITYSAVVQGHTFDGSIVDPNSLVSVKDIFCDIDAKMLAKTVEMLYSLESGSETKIDLVQLDAFTLQAEQDQRDANSNQTGGLFAGLLG